MTLQQIITQYLEERKIDVYGMPFTDGFQTTNEQVCEREGYNQALIDLQNDPTLLSKLQEEVMGVINKLPDSGDNNFYKTVMGRDLDSALKDLFTNEK